MENTSTGIKDTIRRMIKLIKDIVIKYFVIEEGRWWQGKFQGGGFVPAGRLENKYDENDILFSVRIFYSIHNQCDWVHYIVVWVTDLF